MLCPLLPVGDVCVVVPDAPTAEHGTLIMAPSALPAPRRGTLVAKGPEALAAPLAGSCVVWRPFAGTSVEIGAGRWLLLKEDDLVCRLDV